MTPQPEDYPIWRKRRTLIDRTGDVYGRLTVMSFHSYEEGQTVWLCRCECGNEIALSLKKMRSGSNRSCGCWQRENRLHPPPQRGKHIGLGVAAMGAVLHGYRQGAKDRGHAWNLTKEQAIELLQGHCYYCGRAPSQYRHRKGPGGGYTYTGIDRLDPLRGYELGNVVSCCTVCNMKKGTMTELQFRAWVEIVYNHLRRENRIPVVDTVPPFELWKTIRRKGRGVSFEISTGQFPPFGDVMGLKPPPR